MISDVCSDAMADIRRYMTDQPSVYRPHLAQIGVVLWELEKLRRALDAPPGSIFRADEGPNLSVRDAVWHSVAASPGHTNAANLGVKEV